MSELNQSEKRTISFDWDLLSKRRNELFGFSILWIMLFHSSIIEAYFFEGVPILNGVGRFIDYGNMGCEIFVLLSGIGLYFSYSRNSSLFKYYEKRVSRIFIPLWIICLPYWIWCLFQGTIKKKHLLLNISALRLYYDGNQQIWFVTLILLCYVLFPIIYRMIYCEEKGKLLRTVYIMGGFVGFILACSLAMPGFYDKIEIAINRLPIFALGVYFGHLVEGKRRDRWHWWILAVILVVFGFRILDMEILHDMNRRLFYLIPGTALTFVVALIIDKIDIKPINTMLGGLGKISLECYLTHIMLIRVYMAGKFFGLEYDEGNIKHYLLVIIAATILAIIVGWMEGRIIREPWGKTHLRQLEG